MKLDQLREYCLSLPGVEESIKWEHHLCFTIGEKMFLVTAPDDVPVSASFKTSDELFELLITHEGIVPAPYMARNKWVRVDDIKRLSAKDWKKHIDMSYELIFSKLPVKLRNQISEKTEKKAAKKRS